MGALAAFGALRGLGAGVANIGSQMEADRMREEQYAAQLERERLRQAEMSHRNTENNAMRAEIAALREEGRARAGARRGGGGALTVADLAADPALLAVAGGGSREEVEQYLDIARNGAGQTVDRAVEDESGGHSVKAAKYEPGTGKAAMERGQQILMRAMKLADPAHADALSKSETTDYQRGAAQRAEKGDAGAARGALLAAGKGEFGESGTSHVTGVPTKGSVAESQIVENRAQAGNASASAKKHMADVEKLKAEVSGDLKKSSAEKLTTTLNAINGLIRTYKEDGGDDDSLKERRELQQTARAIAAELERRGLGGASKPDAPAAPKPAAIGKLPAGAKQIGTSKGRPVYETPDGKRFVAGS